MKTIRNFLILFFSIILFSCGSKLQKDDPNVYYTCSMHQQIHENKPGNCPICHMDLTKMVVDPNQKKVITLSESQIQLANIKVDSLTFGQIGEDIQLHGRLTLNENNQQTISARVSGRIDKLHFKNIGDVMHKGDLMYEIYSEELLSAQKEYLIAIERQRSNSNNAEYQHFVSSAKNKLLLWGLTNSQLENLQNSKTIHPTVPIYSKESGSIQSIGVSEGDYVGEGLMLFKLVDLSTLWIEVQLFSNEVNAVTLNKPVSYVVSAYPNDRFQGKISFVSPELLTDSRIATGRIEISNASNRFQPGMLVSVDVKTNAKKALVLPINAVLQSQKGATVWIQNEAGGFEIRPITIGIQNAEYVEITSGISEKQRIVVSGAYLLNSEYILKNGNDPLNGVKM